MRHCSEEPFDLHVLGMPPAFVLSQDQTLRLIAQTQQPSIAAKPPDPSSNKSKSVTFRLAYLPSSTTRQSLAGMHPKDAQSDAQIGS